MILLSLFLIAALEYPSTAKVKTIYRSAKVGSKLDVWCTFEPSTAHELMLTAHGCNFGRHVMVFDGCNVRMDNLTGKRPWKNDSTLQCEENNQRVTVKLTVTLNTLNNGVYTCSRRHGRSNVITNITDISQLIDISSVKYEGSNYINCTVLGQHLNGFMYLMNSRETMSNLNSSVKKISVGDAFTHLFPYSGTFVGFQCILSPWSCPSVLLYSVSLRSQARTAVFSASVDKSEETTAITTTKQEATTLGDGLYSTTELDVDVEPPTDSADNILDVIAIAVAVSVAALIAIVAAIFFKNKDKVCHGKKEEPSPNLCWADYMKMVNDDIKK